MEVKPSPDHKMIINVQLLITCFHHYDKTRSRMTTGFSFSRQNDAGSAVCTT